MPLSPEWQLLLAGATTQPTSADMQRLHQVLGHSQLVWARVTQRACAHGIAPLLYHTMQHMGLTEALPSQALEVWQRAMPATIAGVDTRILAPEEGLVYLCLHACHHAGAPMQEGRLNFRLLSCCDITAVIRHDTPIFD